MQTFLPHPTFAASAEVLDYKRLGKQRVETKQLLLALGFPVGNHLPRKSAWANHPCAKMWSKYPVALCVYGIEICTEWRVRGYNDTLLDQFWALRSTMGEYKAPEWLGMHKLHMSHKANLVRKDAEYYSPYFPGIAPAEGYYWPES